MKKPVVAGVLFVVAILGLIIYSSMNLSQYKAEVCMEFQGRRACRTASGESERSAVRTATENACALISSGVTDTIACQNATPVSSKMLK